MAIDPQAEKVVGSMVETEDKDQNFVLEGSGRRKWLDFADVEEAGKFEFDKVHQIFSRDKSNDDYAQQRADQNAKGKNLQTAKLSGDFLAGCERDFRMMRQSWGSRCR